MFKNISNQSFQEFNLVYISYFNKFLKQKFRKMQIADFEQIWDIFAVFFLFYLFCLQLSWQILYSINSPKSTEEAMRKIRFRKWSTIFKISFSKGEIVLHLHFIIYIYQNRKWNFCCKNFRLSIHLECSFHKKWEFYESKIFEEKFQKLLKVGKMGDFRSAP